MEGRLWQKRGGGRRGLEGDCSQFSHHLDGYFLPVALTPCTVDAGEPSLPQEVQDIVILCTRTGVMSETQHLATPPPSSPPPSSPPPPLSPPTVRSVKYIYPFCFLRYLYCGCGQLWWVAPHTPLTTHGHYELSLTSIVSPNRELISPPQLSSRTRGRFSLHDILRTVLCYARGSTRRG